MTFMAFVVRALAAAALLLTVTPTPSSVWDVHAVQFATLRGFPVSSLINGADKTRTLDIAMMVWVLRGPGDRVVLVDAGFHRDKFVARWKPDGYSTPAKAVDAALGIPPERVTDIVISHIHWDHADGVDLFPKARVWIQREEYEHHVDASGGVRDRAIDPVVAGALHAVKTAGRLQFVAGDDQEILPGVRVYTGGRHTFASQYVGVQTRRGTIVLASDNAYLYENFERSVPIAQTLDPASNLAAHARMLQLAGNDTSRIVPGHDPAVFGLFRQVKAGVVRID